MIWQLLRRNAPCISENVNAIESLLDLVDSKINLSMAQGIALFATAIDFRPDTIIELGRGAGNSTVVFAQAASVLGDTTVHSFCISNHWRDQTMPKLEGVVSTEWLGRIVEYNHDLTQHDFSAILGPSRRVIIFWDAHGFEIAEHVLAHIMPLVQDKPHLILCHDISDQRVEPETHLDYGDKRPWRGMTEYYDQPGQFGSLFINWAYTIVDQLLPIFDFCIRNKISLHSADHDYREGLANDPGGSEEVFHMLPGTAPDTKFHYAWFTLNESRGARHFPRRRAGYQQIETHLKSTMGEKMAREFLDIVETNVYGKTAQKEDLHLLASRLREELRSDLQEGLASTQSGLRQEILGSEEKLRLEIHYTWAGIIKWSLRMAAAGIIMVSAVVLVLLRFYQG